MERRRLIRTAMLASGGMLLAGDANQGGIDTPADRRLPGFDGATGWLRSKALGAQELRGRVVLVYFWTYTCINSLRPLPFVRAWAEQYYAAGLTVVGVHTPEFSFEKEPANVGCAVAAQEIAFPVALDSRYRVWQAFQNEYWPAFYLGDRDGRIRHSSFGEGGYGETDRLLRALLSKNRTEPVDPAKVLLPRNDAQMAPSGAVQSPETYVGYRRMERFRSAERIGHNSERVHTLPRYPRVDEWGLAGRWRARAEYTELIQAPGRISFRFRGRDLHMVLAPPMTGQAVSFRVRLDGQPPGGDAGPDAGPDGRGEVREPRLYSLVRQQARVAERQFEVEVFDAGARVYAFTFG